MYTDSVDKIEPYLEPLYIPGALSLFILLVFAYENIYESFIFHNKALFYVILIATIILILVSVLVFVYELLILAKVVKPRALIKKQNKAFKIIRWLFAAAGVASIVFSAFVIIIYIVFLSRGPFGTR